MGKDTTISWCDHTFNPWRGCVEVSEGCDHCYAREQAKRNPKVMGEWGADKPRVLASESKWREVGRWNTASWKAIHQGGRPDRVFCASVADVFEDSNVPMVNSQGEQIERFILPAFEEVFTLKHARVRLWNLISWTTSLRWLLLTKRPENIRKMLPNIKMRAIGSDAFRRAEASWEDTSYAFPAKFSHVWFGTTVESQARAEERIPILCDVAAGLRFLSCEPLLGPIDLAPFLRRGGIGWVIVGGESGGGARDCRLEWVEEIVNDCRHAGVPCFVKQLGKRPMMDGLRQLELIDSKKGGDIDEWPEFLKVRQFPEA